jgi:hypothetical protein
MMRKNLLSKYKSLLLLLLLLFLRLLLFFLYLRFLPLLSVAVVVGEEVVAAEAGVREQVWEVVLQVLLLLLLRPLLFLPLVVVVLVQAEVEEVGAGAGEQEKLVLAVLLEVLRLQEMLAAALLPRKSDSLKRMSTQAAAGLLAYFPYCPTALTTTLVTDARMEHTLGDKLESL